MQATLWFYIIVGLLTIVPLILFNINRVFVRKKPEPMKINWVRGVVILLLCGVIGTFLFSAYSATLHGRYEIALERVATEHAQVLLGQKSAEEFKTFLRENGTENIDASLEALELDTLAQGAEICFQLGNQCTPKYWTEWDGMVNYKEYVKTAATLDLTFYTEESAKVLSEVLDTAVFETATDEEVLTNCINLTAATLNLEPINGKHPETPLALEEELETKIDAMPDVFVWQGKEVITVTDMQANPIYLMYRLDYDGKTDYYAVRLIDTEEGWMYDWIGTPNDQQKKDIKMPTEKNGKWYSVKR
ncbi:MAG: hypothetical protein IJB27_00395 [Clostridia bacterium]|nr:hypothetical protein [Clostridia bacterium]